MRLWITLFFGNPELPIGALIALFCIARWSLVPSDRRRTELLLVVALLSVPWIWVVRLITIGLGHLRHARYDLYIYRIDDFFGQPSFALGRWVVRHPALQSVLEFSYVFLSTMMIVVFTAYLWLRPMPEVLRVVRAFTLNLAAAVPIYLLIPVCGPYFVFADFPARQANVVPHTLWLTTVPNGIPSVHMSTALLIYWFLRRWTLGSIAGILYLVLTILSTLAGGQHYLFDLICGIPYAVAIYYLSAYPWRRRAAAATQNLVNSELCQ